MSDMDSKETVKCKLIKSLCFSQTETRRVKQSLNDGMTDFINQQRENKEMILARTRTERGEEEAICFWVAASANHQDDQRLSLRLPADPAVISEGRRQLPQQNISLRDIKCSDHGTLMVTSFFSVWREIFGNSLQTQNRYEKSINNAASSASSSASVLINLAHLKEFSLTAYFS